MLLLPALTWFFIQLVMSGLVIQSAPARADGLHTITICTGTELTTITVDADGNPVKDIPANKVRCPWGVQLGGIGPVSAPDPANVTPPRTNARRLAVVDVQQIFVNHSHSPYAGRAPPFSTSL